MKSRKLLSVPAIVLMICISLQGLAQRNKKNGSFNAPQIYSLSLDSSVDKPPEPIVKPEQKMLATRQIDTVVIQLGDSAGQGKGNSKLDSLQRQVQQVSKILMLQSFEARYQQLLAQRDTVRRHGLRIQGQKSMTPENMLQLHIYALQSDSITNEMYRLQSYWDKGSFNWDSISRLPVSTSLAIADPLPVLPHAADDTTMHYQKDSSMVVKIDSVYTDTFKVQLDSLKLSLKQNTDSVQVARQALQRSRDSAVYYRQQAAIAKQAATADSVDNRRFFTKLLRAGAGKKKITADEADVNNNELRSDYYNRQVQDLNEKIDRLQKRNTALSDDYRGYEKRQRYTVQTYSNPAPSIVPVVLPQVNASVASKDVQQLRDEMAVLNNQLQLARADSGRKNRTDTVFVKKDAQDIAVLQEKFGQLQSRFSRYQDSLSAKLDTLKAARVDKNPVAREVIQPVAKAPAQISIYFGNGSSAITSLQRQKLARFIQEQGNSNAQFSLGGFTDATGNAAANNALAVKRMQQIESMLVTVYAIPANHIGLLEPVINNSNSKTPSPLDRKVVVTRVN